VSMRVKKGARLCAQGAQRLENVLGLVAGVDDDCFSSLGVGEDCAVALKRPDRESLNEGRWIH